LRKRSKRGRLVEEQWLCLPGRREVKERTGFEGEPKDRKLGDEWLGWEGSNDPDEREIDEKVSTFSILAGCALLMLVALFQLGWYLTKPRFEQISPLLSAIIEWVALVCSAIFILLCIVESISLLKFKKSLFPYTFVERLLLSLLPRTIWLGTKFGISRDRVANSFIKIHNLLVKSQAGRLNHNMLLILLPRCLRKEARSEILNRINSDAAKVYTAAGGEEARKAILQYRPSMILAVACERDLISGIKDVAARIPVFALPNKRPEGPCKNTQLALGDLEDVLRFLIPEKQKTSS
jgi:uncharacterized protein